MHLIAQMYNIYNIHKHTLTLTGVHVMQVAEIRASVDGGVETAAGGHIMPAAERTAPDVGGTELVAGGHIMPVAMMVAPATADGEARFDPLTSINGLFRYPDFTR